MVRVLASSVVDRWFKPRSGQTEEYKIAIGVLLLPGTEPDSLIECNCFRLKTFKTIFNLQLKFCTRYVVHFLPVLDFRVALKPSIVSADVVLAGS
jgi:hypothetical protein